MSRAVLPSLVAVAVSLVTSALLAGDIQYLPDTPGDAVVDVSKVDTAAHKLTPAEAAAFAKNLTALRDAIVAQKIFHPLAGAQVRGDLRIDPERGTGKGPVPGYGHLRYYPSIQFKSGKRGFMEAANDEVVVFINTPAGGLERSNGFFAQPVRAGEINGFPVFRGNGCEYVVISRNGQLPWVPVTREEFVRAQAAVWKKQAAESALDPVSPKVAAAHDEALAKMSREERAMQARYLAWDPFQPMLAPPDSSDGTPLVKPGTSWIDPAAARSDIQLLIGQFWYGGMDPDRPAPSDHGNIAPLRIWETLHKSDWTAIGSIVKKDSE